MLAMVVNDDAGCLDARAALTFFASMLAPTVGGGEQMIDKQKRPAMPGVLY